VVGMRRHRQHDGEGTQAGQRCSVHELLRPRTASL
jgi:hypothetical protein